MASPAALLARGGVMYCITRWPKASRIQSGLPSASSLVNVTCFSLCHTLLASGVRLCATLITSRPRLSSRICAGVSPCCAASRAARVASGEACAAFCSSAAEPAGAPAPRSAVLSRSRYQREPFTVSLASQLVLFHGENSTRLKVPSGISVRTTRPAAS